MQDALHAHALLRRDVDYVVKDGAVLSVDELKGRVVADRRWPPALQTALEAKEGVVRNRQGRVLGSITLQNLVGALSRGLRHDRHGGHARPTSSREIYGLEVEVIPTHRPVIRVDHPDAVFDTRAEKDAAVARRDPERARERPTGAGGHRERRGVGAAEPRALPTSPTRC